MVFFQHFLSRVAINFYGLLLAAIQSDKSIWLKKEVLSKQHLV